MKKYIKVFVFFVVMALLFGCKKSTTTKKTNITTERTTTENTTTRNEFYISFLNYDGVLIYNCAVKRGETPVYNGGTPPRLTDNKYVYTFSGWDKELAPATDDDIYKAVFSATPINHRLTYDLDGGEMDETNPSEFNIETENFTLNTPIREDYDFDGWNAIGEYDGTYWVYNNLFDPEAALNMLRGDDILVKAIWKARKSNVTVTKNLDGGTITGEGIYESGQKVSLHARVNSSYVFDGFYLNNKKLEENYFYMPGHDVNVEARFHIIGDSGLRNVSLTKNINDGGIVYGNASLYIGTTLTIEAIPNSGYIFEGWTYQNDGSLFSKNKKVVFEIEEDMNLVANFKFIKNKVNITNDISSIEYSGIVSGNEYVMDTKLKLSFTNIPTGKYVKMIVNGHIVYGLSYSFVMSEEEINITIKELVDIPYRISGNSVYFGHYPQTLMTEEETIRLNPIVEKTPIGGTVDDVHYTFIDGELTKIIKTFIDINPDTGEAIYEYEYITITDSYIFLSPNDFCITYDWKRNELYRGNGDMWYIDFDDDWDGYNDYRAVYITDYGKPSNIKGNNEYLFDKVYWFKYEEIKWNILNDDNGKLTLVSDLIIDGQYFYPSNGDEEFDHNGSTGYANNYELSYIRKWLNEDFYNFAFSHYDIDVLSELLIDNGINSIEKDSADYMCNDTYDKITLLSDYEIKNYYSSDSDRIAYGSDYSIALGLNKTTNGSSNWYSRSPYRGPHTVRAVMHNGYLASNTANNRNNGIRPVIYLYV